MRWRRHSGLRRCDNQPIKRHPQLHQIELRVAELPELFNSMDPAPFQHRDLDPNAEQFLESWALEFPQDPAPLVAEAIHNHFEYKAVLAKRSLRLLLLEGRTSLLIGIGFLALCLIAADLLSGFASSTFLKLLKESLIIGGWVAMWHPLRIFLYGWWPIVRKGRIYHNLSRAIVHVTPVKT